VLCCPWRRFHPKMTCRRHWTQAVVDQIPSEWRYFKLHLKFWI
jgi:hypothetical protein